MSCETQQSFNGRRTFLSDTQSLVIKTNFMTNDMKKNLQIIDALYPKEEMSPKVLRKYLKIKRNGGDFTWQQLLIIDQDLTALYLNNERADKRKMKENFYDIDQIEFSKSEKGRAKQGFFPKLYGAKQGDYNSQLKARLDFIDYFFNTDSEIFKSRVERYKKTGCAGMKLIDTDTMIEMSSLQDPTKLYDIPKSWKRFIRKKIDKEWRERNEYFSGDKVPVITHAKFCPIIWIKKSEKLKWIEKEQMRIKKEKEKKYK